MTSFRLRRDETNDQGVRRILDGLSHDALAELGDVDPDSAASSVHEARKLCKKGRGLVRLVRPALDDAYHHINTGLRDAARGLAPIRDAHARLGAFDDLVAADAELVPDSGLLGVRDALASDADAATDAVLGPESWRLDRARELITAAVDDAPAWSVPAGFEPLAGGLTKTYRRGRNRFRDTVEAPSVEAHHEWRKRVKYLWYHVRLVRDAAPSVLRPLRRRLHDLSDALGDAHDLAELVAIVTHDDDLDPGERDAFRVMADGRRADLEDRARRLGARLYVEKPKHFVRRIGGYWEAWGDGDERPAGEIGDLFETRRLDGLSDDELRTAARGSGVPTRSDHTRSDLEALTMASGWSTKSGSV